MEMVPETYETCRTTYRTECATETYTAYRTECVPETRTVNKTVTRVVQEWKDECRTVYKCVPTTETRTVMKSVTRCREVTTMTKKVVDQGHWETQCVPVSTSKARKHHHKKKAADCCDPCPVECPQYTTKQVWVPCKVCVEVPCTRTERYTECVPETVCVTVNKMVPSTEVRKVCFNRCVSECVPETVTVLTRRCVPYTATRTVNRCVPVQEKVTCTRMVCRPVTKTIVETPTCTETCAPTCGDTCGDTCGTACCTECAPPAKKKHHLFGRK